MFRNSLKSTLLTIALVSGSIAAGTSAASAADGLRIEFSGPGYSIGYREGGYRYRDDRRFRYDDRRWDRDRRHARKRCSPRRALRKARRNGVRRAHIIRIGHRGIVVAGRQWGDRVVVGFGRHRGCPIRFVRAD